MFYKITRMQHQLHVRGEGNGERRGNKLGEVIREVGCATLKFRLICTESRKFKCPDTPYLKYISALK